MITNNGLQLGKLRATPTLVRPSHLRYGTIAYTRISFLLDVVRLEAAARKGDPGDYISDSGVGSM